MKKSVKIIIGAISAFINFVIVATAVASIYIQQNNKKLFNNSYVVIYQYEVINFNINMDSEPVEIYREKFSKDLTYEAVITSLNKRETNKVVIKNGSIYISESSCYNKVCQHTKIKYGELFVNTEIVCMPNGLIIKLEEGKK